MVLYAHRERQYEHEGHLKRKAEGTVLIPDLARLPRKMKGQVDLLISMLNLNLISNSNG